MASRSEAQSWASQAALNALLKYAPQKSGLNELRRAAEERFKESVSAGRAESVLGQRAAQAAVAPTQQIFSGARASGERGRGLVAPILAALSPDSPFKAAAANEQAAGTERLGQSESHALSDLQQRKAAAAELPAYTRSAAMATLLKELQKVASKQSLLQGSEAADVQSEIGKQRGEANKLSAEERRAQIASEGAERRSERQAQTALDVTSKTSRENARENNQTRREIAEGTGGGVKPLSPDALNKASSALREIEHEARALRQEGVPRGHIYGELTTPQRGTNVPKTDANGRSIKKANGEIEYEKTNDLPAHDVLLTEAALDSVFGYGRVSKGTLQKLHAAGYSLKALGLQGPAPARPQPMPYPKTGGRPGARHPGR